MADSPPAIEERLKRLESWAAERNERLFGFVLGDRIEWRRRSRTRRSTPLTPVKEDELAVAMNSGGTTEPADRTGRPDDWVRTAAALTAIVHDSPRLTIFRTTERRVEQLETAARKGGKPNERRADAPRWRTRFTENETAPAMPHSGAARSPRTGERHEPTSPEEFAEPPNNAAVIRQGAEPGGSRTTGTGFLVTDGEHYGVLTSAETLEKARTARNRIEPMWAVLAGHGPEDARTVRIREATYFGRRARAGRLNLGVGHLARAAVHETGERVSARWLDLRTAEPCTDQELLEGTHAALSAHRTRRLERTTPLTMRRACQADGFNYIEYHGGGAAAGSPVWLQRNDERRGATPPRIAAAAARRVEERSRGRARGNGKTDVHYAVRFDERIIDAAGRLLAAEDCDGNRLREWNDQHLDEMLRKQRTAAKEAEDGTGTAGAPPEAAAYGPGADRTARRRKAALKRCALAQYVHEVKTGEWSWACRILTTQLLRELHAADAAVVEEATREEPERIGGEWDSLIAAVVEFACRAKGLQAPEWVEDERRTRNEPWNPDGAQEYPGEEAWLPAAFLRHGTLTDPKDFDQRVNEHREWEPNEWRSSTERTSRRTCTAWTANLNDKENKRPCTSRAEPR